MQKHLTSKTSLWLLMMVNGVMEKAVLRDQFALIYSNTKNALFSSLNFFKVISLTLWLSLFLKLFYLYSLSSSPGQYFRALGRESPSLTDYKSNYQSAGRFGDSELTHKLSQFNNN